MQYGEIMLKGAVFDFDGTLFDSMFIWDTIGGDYLRPIGYSPREDINEILKPMSLYQAAGYFRSEYGVRLSPEEITEGVNRRIEHFYLNEVQPKENAGHFLEMLSGHGVRMCLATATDRHLVEPALVRCGMEKYFGGIFTCSSAGAGKDSPLIFREAMHFLGTGKQETWIFEDARHAVMTAKEDGFNVAAVYDRYEENQTFIKKTADYYLKDYSDFESFWKAASGV